MRSQRNDEDCGPEITWSAMSAYRCTEVHQPYIQNTSRCRGSLNDVRATWLPILQTNLKREVKLQWQSNFLLWWLWSVTKFILDWHALELPLFQLLLTPSSPRPYAQVLNHLHQFSFTFRNRTNKGEGVNYLSYCPSFRSHSLTSACSQWQRTPQPILSQVKISGKHCSFHVHCPVVVILIVIQKASGSFADKPNICQPCVQLQTSKSNIWLPTLQLQRRKGFTIQTIPAGANHLHHSPSSTKWQRCAGARWQCAGG